MHWCDFRKTSVLLVSEISIEFVFCSFLAKGVQVSCTCLSGIPGVIGGVDASDGGVCGPALIGEQEECRRLCVPPNSGVSGLLCAALPGLGQKEPSREPCRGCLGFPTHLCRLTRSLPSLSPNFLTSEILESLLTHTVAGHFS